MGEVGGVNGSKTFEVRTDTGCRTTPKGEIW